jgi:hypothetical protein
MRASGALLVLLPALLYSADSTLRGFPSKEAQQERAWEEKARAIPRPERISEYIRTISERPHHAGSSASKAIAEYLLKNQQSWGI